MSTTNPHRIGLSEMYAYIENVMIHECMALHSREDRGESPDKYKRNLEIARQIRATIYQAQQAQTPLQQLLITNYPA